MRLKLLTGNSQENSLIENDTKFAKCLTYGCGPVHTLSQPSTAFLIQNDCCDKFSGRNWDEYDNKHDQFKYLQRNITYALFGPPLGTAESNYSELLGSEDELNLIKSDHSGYIGYTKEQSAESQKVYNKVLDFAKYSAGGDRIYMSILYACCVPLIKKKSNTSDLSCYAHVQSFKLLTKPIFKLRKCIRSSNINNPPCCSYIDDHGRVYCNWTNYKEKNKLPEGVLILPKDGTYSKIEVDRQLQVSLDCVLSPASSVKTKALNIANKVGMGIGLGSAGVFATAIFLPVAGPLLIGATVASVATGAFSTTVSSMALRDRSKHEQTLSIKDAEARGCWLNIGASTLGIASGASSQILSVSVSRGIAIGQIFRGTHNGILIASAFTNGLGIANGAYTMIYKYKEHGEKPSSLELLQLSSSLLFFCHSIVNMKTASQVIEETQISTIEYDRSMLRSNRHRKMFDKMAAETRRRTGDITKGNAEVIRSMRQITDKDAFFSSAVRMNKQLNQNNVKISFGGTGEALLNGQHAVNPDILISLSPSERNEIFSNIGPSRLTARNSPTRITFNNTSTGFPISYELSLRSVIKIVELCSSQDDFQEYIINVISEFSGDAFAKMYDIVEEVLTQLLPIHFEQLSSFGTNYNDALLLIFQFVHRFLRENTNINENLSNFINAVCTSDNLRTAIISRVVHDLSDWLRSMFERIEHKTFNCSLCHNVRFSA
ncbi:uncharacterized protein LOC143914775 [Arctopsyche grandis]|uniref:uncharacterized protein LOC143914775 n=1 Tax=Arctopsyche grandis TaxID=121162 RepID=UPI00406D69FC